MYIKIDSVTIDEVYYPRNQCDWRQVERYADALKVGAKFPPIVLGKRKKELVLIDGRHRLEAHRRIAHPRIGYVFTAASEKLWFAEAVRLNAAHGIPLNYQERLMAAMRLSRDGLAADQVERIVGIPSGELEKAVAERGRWISPADAKPMVIKAPLVATARERGQEWVTREAQEIAGEQRVLAASSSLHLIEQVRRLLENDLLERSAEAVAEIERLQAAVLRWLTGATRSAA